MSQSNINAIMTNDGVILLSETQWIQENEKSLEIWDKATSKIEGHSPLVFRVARFRKASKFVSNDGGKTFYQV